MILFTEDSLQQQIYFNDNIFGTNAVVVTRVYCVLPRGLDTLGLLFAIFIRRAIWMTFS